VDYYRTNSLQSVYKEVGTALLYPFKQMEKGQYFVYFSLYTIGPCIP